jgi:predicted DNA-binding antitoxin AbrB/MazE fold protein
MRRNLKAVYEHGVLKPLEPIDLAEHQHVTLAIIEGDAVHGNATTEFEHCLDKLSEGLTSLPGLPADFSRADIYAEHA